jgi:hypothetical protein
MAYCPHCNIRYDETNETQPCCYQCGHPISCGCGGGHSHSPPSPSVPPSALGGAAGEDTSSGQEDDETGFEYDSGEDDSGEDDSGEETSSPGDDLPF